jgi:N-methylhydantoinase A/oxoprolinase/acetone carboxylase beta subunit
MGVARRPNYGASSMRVGADTGGTFTDLVADDGTIAKVLSTGGDPGAAVRAGLRELGSSTPELLAHGTTVATNALLEGRGAPVALVTTRGLGDVIEIGRQDRPSLYDARIVRPEPLVARGWRLEVGGRLAEDGRELEPIHPDAVPEIPPAAEAVAVCLLHADLDPSHELSVASVLRARGHDVCCSHQVSPEFREYERTVTTVVNAALRPRCRTYLQGLAGTATEVVVMSSSGGLLPVEDAAELPAALLLSGPAGGVRAGAAAAVANGFADAITFDMGGTSTDVCLVLEGAPAPAAERHVGGFTVRFPSLDIHTIGAGGGSIASIDPGGALVVGPRSAGAEPGPACYGRGGTAATVTDADLVAGRIRAGASFGGLPLDPAAAARSLADAGVTAHGVIAVVDANMEQALRAVSVERGIDPRGLALVAFGGAGPLHACALAESLGMPAVVVPARAGVLSAVDLLTSPRQRDLVRSWATPADLRGLEQALEHLASDARALVGDHADTVVTTAVDCRYAGQSHELTVPTVDDFHAAHRDRNGYSRDGAVVEVVSLRATARRPAPIASHDLPVDARREGATGPAVLAEPDCTIWVPEGWRAEPGRAGALVLRRT